MQQAGAGVEGDATYQQIEEVFFPRDPHLHYLKTFVCLYMHHSQYAMPPLSFYAIPSTGMKPQSNMAWVSSKNAAKSKSKFPCLDCKIT